VLDFHTEQTSEASGLLGELLDGERAGGHAVSDIAPDIVELRDMARLLRAASHSVPLPEGRLVVRRTLLATAQQGRPEEIPARAAWRRTGRWLSVAATLGMIVAAFSLGAGLLDGVGSRSNPLYGLRLAVDRARLALIPHWTQGTGSPARSAQARTVEIDEIAASGFSRPAGAVGYPLTYRFAGVTIPSRSGEEITVEGTVGGLPVTLSLTAASGCPAGTTCGVFEAWVTPLRGTLASAEFGQMRGTFICAAAECKLTLVSKTGIFNKINATVLPANAGTTARLVETSIASLGDWVATVEQAAARLKSEGLLPAGVTVTDLVSDAATNQSAPKHFPQGKIGEDETSASSGPAGVPVGVDDGAFSPDAATGSSHQGIGIHSNARGGASGGGSVEGGVSVSAGGGTGIVGGVGVGTSKGTSITGGLSVSTNPGASITGGVSVSTNGTSITGGVTVSTNGTTSSPSSSVAVSGTAASSGGGTSTMVSVTTATSVASTATSTSATASGNVSGSTASGNANGTAAGAGGAGANASGGSSSGTAGGSASAGGSTNGSGTGVSGGVSGGTAGGSASVSGSAGGRSTNGSVSGGTKNGGVNVSGGVSVGGVSIGGGVSVGGGAGGGKTGDGGTGGGTDKAGTH
jgi:hypothetical protein